MQGTLQGFLQLGSTTKEMGNVLKIKCISTGTVTRMDLNKASSKFLFLQVILINIVCSLLLTVECFFFKRISTITFIIVCSDLTL